MYTTKSKFVSSNKDYNQTICWKMLSDAQSEEIFLTALELLERSGAQVANEKALEILAKGGCWVDGDMVRIPSAKLEWAVRTAPSRLTLCDRHGKRAVMMEAESVAFGPGYGASSILDIKTGEPRPLTLKDIEEQAHLSEKLGNIEVVSAFGAPGGEGKGVASLQAMEQVMRFSTKPIVQPVCCEKLASFAVDMAAAAVGGKEKLQRDPYLVLTTVCDEPRWHSEEAMDVVMFAAREGIPVVYVNDLVAGKTAPASSAGTLVVGLANYLVALLVAQLVREGSPVIGGARFSFNDGNDAAPRGAPETSLIGAGFANLMRWLRLPSFAISGITDSVVSDSQTGVECAMSLLTAGLAGTNIISGGLLASGKTASLPILAMNEEVMSHVYRIMRSFAMDEDRKAVGVYDKVEPGGSYLGEDHTSLFFKSEQYWPNLFSRLRLKDWVEAGSKSFGQRATEYVETVLAEPRIDEDAKASAAVKVVLSKAESEL